jgi:predicted ATPase
LRSVAKDIEAVEKRISSVTAPRNHFTTLINDLLYAGKTLTLTPDTLEVTSAGQKLQLGTLSSGEKQLLWILLETMMTQMSVILVDEPELSMHVDWQRRLVFAMRTVGHLSQMILATHSPEIMADLHNSKIFKL